MSADITVVPVGPGIVHLRTGFGRPSIYVDLSHPRAAVRETVRALLPDDYVRALHLVYGAGSGYPEHHGD
jgi:hypothetical protein